MARVPELRQDSMTEAQRKVAQEIVSGPHGRIVGPYHAWLSSPELASRARNLSEHIRFKSSVPKRLQELGILITGRYWKAEFEYYAHAKLAKQAGLDEAVISAIAKKQRPSFKNPDEETVYNLCMEMYETRRIGDKTYAQALQLLGLPALVELIATIGYYSMVSMTLNAFQIPLPAGEASPFPD
jgi:4-carboxymuconolactone decarboxylase